MIGVGIAQLPTVVPYQIPKFISNEKEVKEIKNPNKDIATKMIESRVKIVLISAIVTMVTALLLQKPAHFEVKFLGAYVEADFYEQSGK